MFDIRLLDSVVHLLSSGFAGLLAYFSISTICWSWYGRGCPSRSRTSPRERVARSISRFSWASALFVSIGVHVFLDYFVGAHKPVCF